MIHYNWIIGGEVESGLEFFFILVIQKKTSVD